MKFVVFSLLVVVGFSVSACGEGPKTDDGSYDRANKASKESLKGLDRDTK